jgi:hypothetical protein
MYDQITAHLIKAGGMAIRSAIQKDYLFRIGRNYMRSGRKVIKQFVVIIETSQNYRDISQNYREISQNYRDITKL